jgi:creatinine amidohydrolase
MHKYGVCLQELNAGQVAAGAYDKAVVGVGATEYHGPHLPYGADTLVAQELALRVAGRMKGMLVLPPIAYGMSWHHQSFPWTLSLSPETLTRLIYDVAASLSATNISKLLVITAHDGNVAPVEMAARQLHHDQGMHLAVMFGWQERARAVLATEGYTVDLNHAGQSETSAVMAVAPDLVDVTTTHNTPDEPVSLPIRVFGSYAQIAPAGYAGAAAQGNAADGERLLQAAVNHVLPFLEALDHHGWQLGDWIRAWQTSR